MIERIRELDSDQVNRLKKLGHDALAAISPPIASMVYSQNPDQLQALQNIGPDALGAMSPQLADYIYGPDLADGDQGVGQTLIMPDKGLGRYPGQPPIILPPFPQPPRPQPPEGGEEPFPPYPDEDLPDLDDDEDKYRPDPGDMVVWWSFADACEPCLDNAAAPPRPYGEPFPSGDVEPPMHDHCRCNLMSAMRGACPIHGYSRSDNRIFELSSRY